MWLSPAPQGQGNDSERGRAGRSYIRSFARRVGSCGRQSAPGALRGGTGKRFQPEAEALSTDPLAVEPLVCMSYIWPIASPQSIRTLGERDGCTQRERTCQGRRGGLGGNSHAFSNMVYAAVSVPAFRAVHTSAHTTGSRPARCVWLSLSAICKRAMSDTGLFYHPFCMLLHAA